MSRANEEKENFRTIRVGKRESFVRGVYAIEFAFVFLFFFAIIYAILAYGVVFAIRQNLQYAAEEGARAGLRYPGAGTTAQKIAARKNTAISVAQGRTWIVSSTPSAYICNRNVDCVATDGDCVPGTDRACQIVVTLTYDYANAPIFQSMPGVGLIMPAKLVGKASVLLSTQALAL
jgi:Flp pilus assembly protein TadG